MISSVKHLFNPSVLSDTSPFRGGKGLIICCLIVKTMLSYSFDKVSPERGDVSVADRGVNFYKLVHIEGFAL